MYPGVAAWCDGLSPGGAPQVALVGRHIDARRRHLRHVIGHIVVAIGRLGQFRLEDPLVAVHCERQRSGYVAARAERAPAYVASSASGAVAYRCVLHELASCACWPRPRFHSVTCSARNVHGIFENVGKYFEMEKGSDL